MTRIELSDHDVVGIRADNPGPLTLTGTNSWIVGRGPAWLIDPGPVLGPHLDALSDELHVRGGLGGIALTHRHTDHAAGLAGMLERFPDAVRSAGPLERLALPGHAPDHVAFLHAATATATATATAGAAGGVVAFSGDAILGEGSVFIAPDPGAMAGYLTGLARLRERHPVLIAPGHGPLITDPDAKISEYLAHRNAREQRLLNALAEGSRSIDELLDAAWGEVAGPLAFAAAATLAAHLDKLEAEGRLPDGVQRPAWPIAPPAESATVNQ